MRERFRIFIRLTCEEIGAHIVKSVLARDHIHMFISIPPKLALSTVMQRIKGRSSRRVRRSLRCESATGAADSGPEVIFPPQLAK